MSNFINQFKKEHNLIDELVTNAFESAERIITVIHTGNSIIFKNDGMGMSYDQIKYKLLTAFETGEEKSFETNRGLGFIAIYGYMTRTIVRTGNLSVNIFSWDDIKVNKKAKVVEGIEIKVYLNNDAKIKYSEANVRRHLSNWYYQEKTLLFGTNDSNAKQIGNYVKSLNIKSNNKFRYKNLKYIDDQIIDSDADLTFLLKLTNINVYRLLPIKMNLDNFIDNNHLNHIALIISHGSYLDATRRSLSKFGQEQVTIFLNLLNDKKIAKTISKNFFKINQLARNEMSKALEFLERNLRSDFLSNVFSNMTSVTKIVEQIFYFDKLLELMSSDNRILLKIKSIYPGISEFDVCVTATDFYNWIKVNLKDLSLFSNITIGYRYEYAILLGEATLLDLKEHEWIPFDQKIISSQILNNEKVILGFDILRYISDKPPLDTQELIKRNVRRIVDGKTVYNQINYEYLGEQLVNLDIEQIHLKRKIMNNTEILFLVYPNKLQEFDTLEINNQTDKIFSKWRDTIAIGLNAYLQTQDQNILLHKNLQPVFLFGKTDTIACSFSNFLGIDFEIFKNIESQTELFLKVVFPAIHEIAHVFERKHNDRFSRIEGQILSRLQKETYMKQLISIFY